MLNDMVFLTLFILTLLTQKLHSKLSLITFETDVLSVYMKQYEFNQTTSDHSHDYNYNNTNTIGRFSFEPLSILEHNGDVNNRTNESIYGTSDMIHLLHFVGQLSSYVDYKKDIILHWIDYVESFQNTTGFYHLLPQESVSGYQPWHATAYVASALYLLNNQTTPLYNNTVYDNLVQTDNQTLWNQTFSSLVNMQQGIEQGCNSIHACCHKIAAIPAVIATQTGIFPLSLSSHDNQSKYNYYDYYNKPKENGLDIGYRLKNTRTYKFLDWWLNDFIYQNLNSTFGVLCPYDDENAYGKSTCIGSGACIHLIDTYFNISPWPYLNNTYNFIKNRYLKSNCTNTIGIKLFSPDCNINTFTNFDGIYQLTRSSIQLGYFEWNSFVKSVCNDYLNYVVPILNNQSTVLYQTGDVYGLSKNTHVMPGVIAAVAECVMQFPDLVETMYNWKCCAPFP